MVKADYRRKIDYSERDRQGQVTFFVLLWKRKGITLELFDNYWKDVHGPVCARLPGQYQYWQHHLAHSESDIWQATEGVDFNCPPEDQFDGIAELTFASDADRQTWFKAAAILMDDEHNLFSKAIGYNTSSGNSITYFDGIPTGDPNGPLDVLKYLVMVKKANNVSTEAFRRYLKDSFAEAVANSENLLKFRLHLFDEVDNSRPDAAGVVHYEPAEKQYQAAFEMAFATPLQKESFFASKEYEKAVENLGKYAKQLLPFPLRTAYTFVYDGEMTLAGQRGSKVAHLITNIGATNQLKPDVVSLMGGGESPQMNGQKPIKSGLGHFLQGMQHVGVTVADLQKSIEFYVDVLGGKFVVEENGLVGDAMQNNLFQKEALEAVSRGQDPRTIGIPNLRDGQEALDVKFISFGNAVIELIFFRDAKNPKATETSVGSIPGHIGNVNAMHISFHVKEDVDLNLFAKNLEEECHRRGMTDVVCNRVIWVKSEAERKAVALKYNSIKFWDEPEELAEGHAPHDYGDFEGWALFYCKGPNGEQLEFNQVTRKVKNRFIEAQQAYNRATGTAFTFQEATTNNGSTAYNHTSPANSLYVTFSSPVNAAPSTVWEIVKDKIENPKKYNPAAQNTQILERYSDGVLRQMSALGMTVKERITIDEKARSIRHTLVDNQYFRGKTFNTVVLPLSDRPNEPPVVSYTMDWEPLNNEAQKLVTEIKDKVVRAVQESVLNAKDAAERRDPRTETPVHVNVPGITNNGSPTMTEEKLPGANTDLVKRLFSRGEAFDVPGFLTFFTDTPIYQFGNFDVALNKEAIRKSADAFFSQITAVYHDIKMMWEVGNIVFVEMDVAYWRLDGSMVTLPCFDIFRVEGDKFAELRIFMDVNPVFDPKIPVPSSASVLTISQGKRMIPPGTMRKHFAEHPEGKERVAKGFIPKWSIAGPKWPIEGQNSSTAQSDQLKAVIQMSEHILKEEWEEAKKYLTDDLLYKVGSGDALYGKQAVVDFLGGIFKNVAVLYGHDVRKVWDEPNIITFEMDAKYRRNKDGKELRVACVDIYRMRGNQVCEWRVYPDMSPFYAD